LQSSLDSGATSVTLASGRTYMLDRAVNVPSGVTLNLNGATLYHSGPQDSDAGHTYAALVLADGTTNVTITGGTIRGNHASGYTNHQSKTVLIEGTTCANIVFNGVAFENIVGLPIQLSAVNGADSVDVVNCTFTNCGNGVNINGANGAYTGNTFTNAEGFEIAGSGNLIDDNDFTVYLVAISLGGDSSGGTLVGNTISNNRIHSSTGWGIILADGCHTTTISGNTIEGCVNGGITQALSNPAFPIVDTTISSNTITLISGKGIQVLNFAGISNVVINANTINGSGTYGLHIYSASTVVTNNLCAGSGATADIRLESTASGMTFADNTYTTLVDNR
jgi:parallel beta-helix repeat protein